MRFSSPYGGKFTGVGKEGKLLAYRVITPYQVHRIPEGPVQPGDVAEHPWDFEEGLHVNFLDTDGQRVAELHEHRLMANHVLEINNTEQLQFAQYDNHGLTPGDSRRNQRLVKRVSTDRRGTIRLHYNSAHEVRNAATAYSAAFATDSWPHMLLVQRFPEPIRLDDFERIDFTLDYQVVLLRQLSDWPARGSGVPARHESAALFFPPRDRASRARYGSGSALRERTQALRSPFGVGPMGHRVLSEPSRHRGLYRGNATSAMCGAN